jgi:hypothetical protein
LHPWLIICLPRWLICARPYTILASSARSGPWSLKWLQHLEYIPACDAGIPMPDLGPFLALNPLSQVQLKYWKLLAHLYLNCERRLLWS